MGGIGRGKSPGVSFAEEVIDFEERQYQTVHAGCEIAVKPRATPPSKNSRAGTGKRPSIIEWPMGKFGWIKDRQRVPSKSSVSKVETNEKNETKEVDDLQETE